MTATILVVEHDPAICALLVDCLGDEGYQVMTASTGYAALHLLATLSVDLMIIDRGLPDTDGLTLWHHVRAIPKTRTLPLVIMSGRKGISLSGDHTTVLTKPFDLDTLFRLVATMLV